MAGKGITPELKAQLIEIDLETLVPKLAALGVRTQQDLSLVDDADLVRWGLSTIQRRRFFLFVRSRLGKGDQDAGYLPPSALTVVPMSSKGKEKEPGGQRKRRSEAMSTTTLGPARLDELLGRGSAEHQVPRLGERILAATGPIDLSELSTRLSRAAPALAQGYDEIEWPMFVEACIRAYSRLRVEDGILQGDVPIVSICNAVLFSASEEVVADIACWLRTAQCLATPKQVAVITTLCRASREVCDGPAVWSKLLGRWYPKATLLNPDWVAQTELEKRLEEALENDYAFAALTKRLQPDTPYDIGELLRALPQQSTPKALMKFMSRHEDNFKQSPDGSKFCISRPPEDLRVCKDWRTVNPFRTPVQLVGSSVVVVGQVGAGGAEKLPAPVPMGRPSGLKKMDIPDGDAPEVKPDGDAPEVKPQQICQKLDPKQAFRLYHTGLLSQQSMERLYTDQSKRENLEAWEYYTESNSNGKKDMPAFELCNLSESRVQAVRCNDPAVVHELVAQTIEGLVYKVPFGFWNRRVRIVSMALNASQLRIGREQRKKFERKLVEFMEWVKKERGFGFYQCDACGSRWKSGFSYEEIMQQCLQCGTYAKPYRIQDLESAEARGARERGEAVPETEERKGISWNAVSRAPPVNFEAPQIRHVSGVADRRALLQNKRSYDDMDGKGSSGKVEMLRARFQRSRADAPTVVAPPVRELRPGTADGATNPSIVPPGGPVTVPARSSMWSAGTPAVDPGVQIAGPGVDRSSIRTTGATAAAGTPTFISDTSQYVAGGGGFFARRQAAAAADVAGTAATAADASRYTPGGGGFFARRQAAQATGSATTGTTSAAAPTVPAAAAAAAPAVPAEPARYTPGGGGFFSRRQGAPAAAAAGAAAVAVAPASAAAASNGARPRSRSPRRVVAPAVATPIHDDVAAAAAACGLDLFDLTTLGLSEEEAKTMGLVSDTPTRPLAVKEEPIEVKQEPEEPPPPDLSALGLSEEEAKAMGIVPDLPKSKDHEPKATPSSPGIAATREQQPDKTIDDYLPDEVADDDDDDTVAKAEDAVAAPVAASAGDDGNNATEDVAMSDISAEVKAAREAAIPQAKLLALKTLGVSFEDGVRMGIITAAEAEAAASGGRGAAPVAAKAARSSKPPITKKAAPIHDDCPEDAPGEAATSLDDMDVDAVPIDVAAAGDKLMIGITAAAGESLVDAVTAVVSFAQASSSGGGGREKLTHQSSDIWYLLSDAVMWPLLRRLGAEIVALEDGVGQNEQQDDEIWEAAWALAPRGREAASNFIEERGYLLPEESRSSVASDGLWRHALLIEACADLMAVRIGVSRGFKNLAALACPASSLDSEELKDAVGVGSISQRISLAHRLVGELATATSSDSSEFLGAQLMHIANSVKAKPCKTIADGHEGPVLVGGWSLLQEMHVREISINWHREYSVRRQILLSRLDVTLESMCAGRKVLALDAASQRKVAGALAKMWAGWRCGAAEAPRLSEWSALLVTRSKLARAIHARIAESGETGQSKLKSMRIGNLPCRGGVAPGASGRDAVATTQKSTTEPDAATKKSKPRAVTETGGAMASASSSDVGSTQPGMTMGDIDGSAPSFMASKPREKGDGKGTSQGARSTNKELMQEYKRDLKNPKEAPNYYKGLGEMRGGGER